MRKSGMAVLALVGCTPVTPTAPLQPEIIIDLERKVASAPDWQTPLTDCSNTEFQCVEAPGHFLMAFPRICPKVSWDWNVAGFRYRLTAPAAHYGLPSGGYYSEKYPHSYLLYRAGKGFDALWLRANPVPTDNWGGYSTAEYRIRYIGGPGPFVCKEQP